MITKHGTFSTVECDWCGFNKDFGSTILAEVVDMAEEAGWEHRRTCPPIRRPDDACPECSRKHEMAREYTREDYEADQADAAYSSGEIGHRRKAK
jgi:hypothetical protein